MASESSRDRGEQILSAKKKLKSYRAKQALMAQKRSSSSSSHSRSGSGVRSVDAPSSTAVAEALSNEIVSQASTSSSFPTTATSAASHTRTPSRSGHARGHSRAGSISITPNALWSQAQAIASSPAPASAPMLGRPASIVAPSAGHVRTHSRSHSRNFSHSRPVSISMLGAKKEEPIVLAIEHRAEQETPPVVNNIQRTSQQFLDSSALFGGSVSSSNLRPDSTASAKRFSNVAPISPALFDRPASQQNVAATASPSPSAPNSRHSRRLSRHARTPSVSTKRESMEIMGGLGTGLGLDMASASTPLHSVGSSKRRSSRMSNLPSASLLFGSSDPATNINSAPNNVRNSSRASGQQWDWRKAIADAASEAEESSEGRLTALEKLEGRTSTTRASTSDRPSSVIVAASRASRRLSGHTRSESIQIPNLDEIHQNELNERRASWNSQAFDGPTMASAAVPASAPAASTSTRRESWGRSLVPPSPSSLLNAGFASPALPSAYLSSPGRPESMVLRPESPQPEGLGTLMEEEEEDDATSPSRERPSLDMPVDGRTSVEQELHKQRKEVEDETVKRNRRASLAPKPLKLKSRPPSLYLTPSQRSGLVSSPSMPNFPTSPLLAPSSIADEATPRATMAALPEVTDDDESQVLEQHDTSEAMGTLPSRSTTCPDLASLSVVSEEAEQNGSFSDANEAEETQDAASPVNHDLSAQEVASQEQRQLEELQEQILRAHRNSVIAPPAAATPSTADSTAMSSGSASSSSRQGMRTLRLGSQANLASIMESASASNAATSAAATVGTTATATPTTTTPAQRRRSLIMGSLPGVSMSGSSSRDSEFAPFSSSATSSRAARRSSIIYKPSTASVPEMSSPHSASDSIVSLGGVPLAVHDELKAKANLDAALLESTKKQVEMLERELANEAERSAREKAELEQWNLDKEEHLFDRAQRAETAARQAEDALVSMRAELEQAKETEEDLQAEREVLQDDIEGWRSRCQDLEKLLRTEKAKSDDNRKLRAAARLRVKQLTDALEQSGADVPADELGVLAALEMPQLDLAAALKSPNLGAVSPSLGASAGLSPSIGSEEAPPQITKLLASMRQQIFNLAGSLEHERKQHLQAKEEVVRLQRGSTQQEQDQPQQPQQPQPGAQNDEEATPATDVAAAEEQSFASPDVSRDMSTSESFSSSVRRSSGMLGKNKRHVFAYDSSMGSFGQSQSSASLSMTMMTDDTAHTDVDSDASDSFSTKLPSSSESELVGLGMGSLQTLDEIEEVSEVSESLEGSHGTLSAAVGTEGASPAWVDVEAGEFEVVRPSFDESEASFGAQYQDAENAPPTPDLYRSTEEQPAAALGGVHRSVSGEGEHSTNASCCSSSGDSHAAPSTPPQHATARLGDETTGTITAATMAPPSPRPEFHREWSFEWGKSRSAKTPGCMPEQHTVEDFFGIFSEDRLLPALSSSDEALDLPPITLQPNGTLLPTARLNKEGKPVGGAATTMRSASVFGGGARRPPVARSAYLRESFDSTSPQPHFAQQQPQQYSGGAAAAGYGHEASASSASSLVASIGSRALSRMSLQHLTGAFSGLSGYLTNQGGAATAAAVAAAKMCNAAEDMEEGGSASVWANAQRVREEEDDDDDEESAVDARSLRFDIESGMGSKQQAPAQAQAVRRYVRKSAVAQPKATAVWMLDFSRSVGGVGPVFSL
ncbi:hypothetical protein EX895_004317 [Sporisorium graminicola]|uniref:Uncharacterized protein n=1 Tax=Sporisorium graminicola TaxID=280036 RepID=A0A4U7KRT8_9BASI|nr:hypothetical protein EX895_004317 [Sporisorium graminicola]TKY86677.1 hypothetical protein EX895_004317 [Sporisorium graminicola]